MEHTGRNLFGPVDWGDPVEHDGSFLLPTGTVTVLLGDVEGSTRRWEVDETSMAAASSEHSQFLADVIGRNGGVRPLEQGEGDSFVAAFARASDAVACATEIALEAPLPTRMAVHTGEAHRTDDGTYVGPTLNRAGRLRDAAHGGQIVVSRVAAELVADRLPKGVRLRDLGRHRLRDLERPEQIFQVVHSDLRAEFPSLRTLDTYRHNLPQQQTPLFGRSLELADLTEAVLNGRLVTIAGPGGCGKTRLAVELAARLLDDHPDGCYFAELSPLPAGADLTAVGRAVGHSLGLTDEAAGDPVSFLRGKRALVVLDNCEHVVAACAQLADQVLALPGEELRLVATSREPLSVSGEQTYLLSSLAVPPAASDALVEAIPSYAAAELFLDRARRSRADFRPEGADLEAIGDICRRLDGIPLAIELAAARIRVLTPRQIVDGLDQRFELLTGGPRTALPRQQTLRASVDWSYQLLTGAEQVTLCRLAVFAANFDLGAAVAVCGVSPIEPHHVLDLLSLLVDKSLVVTVPGDGAARYRLLDTIRRFALDRLAAEDLAGARRRHRDHYLGAAEQAAAELFGEQGVDVYEQLLADWPDSAAAFDWSLEQDDIDAAARFASAFAEPLTFLWIGAPLPWFDAVLARFSSVTNVARLGFLFAYACHLLKTQQPATSELTTLARDTLSATSDGEDELVKAPGTLVRTAVVAAVFGVDGPDEALARSLAAVDAAMASGQVDLAVIAQIAAWRSARSAGSPETMRLAERVTELVIEGGPMLQAVVLSAYGAFGASPNAMLQMSERLSSGPVVRLPAVHRHVVRDAAFAWEALGGYDEAAALADQVYGGFAENGDRNCAGWMLEVRSHQPERAGDLARARELCDLALDLLGGTPLWLAFSPMLIARSAALFVTAGDLQSAWAAHEAIEAVRRSEQGPFHRVFADLAGALISFVEGDDGRGESLAFSALDETVRTGGNALPTALGLVAVAVARGGRAADATRLLGACRSLEAEEGSRAAWVAMARLFSETIESLRATLGSGEVESLLHEGASMTRDAAIAYARRGRGVRRRPAAGWSSLTPAELQVVELVAQGLSNAAVAARLFISLRTVTTHLSHVYAKLAVSSRTELTVLALARADRGPT